MTKILVDPMKYHIPNLSHTEGTILERCTVLNHWVNTCPITLSLMECFKAHYSWGWHEWDEETYVISDDGIYQSRDTNPDLTPLMQYEREDEDVFVYEYDIVAFRGEYGTIVCRLD